MTKRTWQEVLNDQAAAREDREPRRSIAVNFPNELYSLISAAARGRDMSMTAYMRRAALAFAQFDVGFDWAEEMRREPGIGPFDPQEASFKHRPLLHGHDYGPWFIDVLVKHFPDDA